MRVYFKAPETAPHCQMEYLFPNTADVPFSFSGDGLIARYADDAEYYKLLQKDLMDLAVATAAFLTDTPTAADVQAIVYYRAQSLTAKGQCKNLLPEALFSFGVAICSSYGECKCTLYPKLNRQLLVEFEGGGIAERLARHIILPHPWSVRVEIGFRSFSRFREIIARSQPGHQWYGYFGKAFNVPREEIWP